MYLRRRRPGGVGPPSGHVAARPEAHAERTAGGHQPVERPIEREPADRRHRAAACPRARLGSGELDRHAEAGDGVAVGGGRGVGHGVDREHRGTGDPERGERQRPAGPRRGGRERPAREEPVADPDPERRAVPSVRERRAQHQRVCAVGVAGRGVAVRVEVEPDPLAGEQRARGGRVVGQRHPERQIALRVARDIDRADVGGRVRRVEGAAAVDLIAGAVSRRLLPGGRGRARHRRRGRGQRPRGQSREDSEPATSQHDPSLRAECRSRRRDRGFTPTRVQALRRIPRSPRTDLRRGRAGGRRDARAGARRPGVTAGGPGRARWPRS